MKGEYRRAVDALRAAATCLRCDWELRSWHCWGAALTLEHSTSGMSTTIRITAVEAFGKWVVVARLPIPDSDLSIENAKNEAGIGLALLSQMGHARPKTPIAIGANGSAFEWPLGGKPAGVLIADHRRPLVYLMNSNQAHRISTYIRQKISAIEEAVAKKDPEIAERFDASTSGPPSWFEESGPNPLDLGELERDLTRDLRSFKQSPPR